MHTNGSLLERLANRKSQRPTGSPEQLIMGSVANHLTKMLSTRAGSVQTLSDYGLPDLNDMRMSLHDSLTHSREAIQLFISRYEPRLSDVKVIALPREPAALNLAFEIHGWIEVDGRKRQASFSASLEGGGRVKVQ